MPSPADYPLLADSLLKTVRRLASQGWCPATGGNFSARVNDELRLITQSGRDKGSVELNDLMLCTPQGKALDPACRPSDETALHMALYRLSDDIGCVLHTHSVAATVLSRRCESDALWFEGFEMQKALQGQSTHEARLPLAVFDNSQDIDALAAQVTARWDELPLPALLVRGHGMYCWGQNIAQAQRHVEGLEFLLSCALQEQLLGATS